MRREVFLCLCGRKDYCQRKQAEMLYRAEVSIATKYTSRIARIDIHGFPFPLHDLSVASQVKF